MISELIKIFLLKLIRFYQKYFSPDTSPLSLIHPFFGACKFQPTCSEYAYQAIEKFGVFKGLIKAITRILRCHPFSRGGWDPP
jgi:uncharacterized protein